MQCVLVLLANSIGAAAGLGAARRGAFGFNEAALSAALYFEQRVDHYATTGRMATATSPQAYFTNATFDSGNGPVFLYVGGEGPLSSTSATRNFIVDWLPATGGLLFALEHRYYGKLCYSPRIQPPTPVQSRPHPTLNPTVARMPQCKLVPVQHDRPSPQHPRPDALPDDRPGPRRPCDVCPREAGIVRAGKASSLGPYRWLISRDARRLCTRTLPRRLRVRRRIVCTSACPP